MPRASTAREAKGDGAAIALISSLKGALSSFKTAVDTLKTAATLSPRTTTSSEADVFTATPPVTRPRAAIDIEVVALAKAQQLASKAFDGGGTARSARESSRSASARPLRSRHRLDQEHARRHAQCHQQGDAATPACRRRSSMKRTAPDLVLTSAKTGADNTINDRCSGGDGGLAELDYAGVLPRT